MSRIKEYESRIKGIALCFISIILNSFFIIRPVYAQTAIPIGDKFGFGNFHSLGDATTRLVNPAFQIAAALVLIFMLFGAFKYLTSEGNKESVEEARKMMTNAFIGSIILMFAFLALKYLLYALFGIEGNIFELINSK